jgi:nicotinamide-nucleotide amidase
VTNGADGDDAPRGGASGHAARTPRAESARRERSLAVVGTGDELVFGQHVDTNSGAIARRFQDIGWQPRRFVVLGDDEDGLVHELLELATGHAVIVLTGGLGPTLDDVTRHACARAAGVDLVLDAGVLRDLQHLFESRGRPFAQSNERQALFPRGADVLPNPHGTAAGFCVEVAGSLVFALPGPPREMLPMLEREVLPRVLRALPAREHHERRTFYLFGLSESAFADMCGAWMDRDAEPLVGVTARHGVLSVTIRARGTTPDLARESADRRAAEVRERFGAWLFSESDSEPCFALGRELLARRLRVAVAESCTGGLVAARLTSVPGISAVFDRGFVTYANEAKTELLGVDPALLAAHGAVSAPVAAAMARGAAERSRVPLAVSVTGVAGPDGGTAEKPVGLVVFGVYRHGQVTTEERRFVVRERDLIREFAANTALDLLRRAAIEIG